MYIHRHGFKYFLYAKALRNRLKTAACYTGKDYVYMSIYTIYMHTYTYIYEKGKS